MCFIALSAKDLIVMPELLGDHLGEYLAVRGAISACLFLISMYVRTRTGLPLIWLKGATLLAVALLAGAIEGMVLQSGIEYSVYFVGHIILGVCVMAFIPAGMSFHVLSVLIIQLIYSVPVIMFLPAHNMGPFISANLLMLVVFASSLFASRMAEEGTLKELGLRYDLLKAEEGLRNAKDDLEQRVNERTAQLSALNEQMEQYNEELLKTQSKLQSASQQWRSTFDAARELIIMLDVDGRFVKVNKAAVAFFGMDFHSLLGSDAVEVLSGSMPVDDRNPLVRHLRSHSQEEEELRLSEGESWVLISVDPISSDQDEFIGSVVFIRDITDLKRTQGSLNQVQKMDTIGRLAGGIAHDFNNILSVILGYAESVRRALPPGPVAEEAEKIHTAGCRARDLTRQLLAISRKQVLDFRAIGLNQVVMMSLSMLKRLLGELVEVRFTPASGSPTVRADQGGLEQVLMNLLVNARDAMPEGGVVTISVLTNAEPPAALGLKGGSYAAIVVKDSGMGIDPEVRARLFEPFFTTKGVGKGTGLGLATVYAIVAQHKGAIDVQSEPGEGAEFIVYLPSTAEVPTVEPTKVKIAPASGGSESILVVDDDDMLREFVRTCLGQFGYQVIEAPEGATALAMLRSGATVDLVLTDVVMPGIDGRVLGRTVRAEFPSIRLIYMTGYPDNAFSDGREGEMVLLKPLGIDVLLTSIRKSLDERPPKDGAAPQGCAVEYCSAYHQGLRVLLVEDDPDQASLLTMYLENYFDTVDHALEPAEAMQRFEAQPYDAVITDLNLPGEGGAGFVRTLRKWELKHGGQETVVVLLSGSALTEAPAGVTHIMQKPADIPSLVRAVCSAHTPPDADNICPMPEDPAVMKIREHIASMLPQYIEHKIADVALMREALNSGDMSTVKRLGHSLKGSGSSYGLSEISEAGKTIESAASEGDQLTTLRAIDTLDIVLQRLRDMPSGTGE